MKINALVNSEVEVDIDLNQVIDAMLARCDGDTVREVMITMNSIHRYLSRIPDGLIAAHSAQSRTIIHHALLDQAGRWGDGREEG